VPPPAEKGSPLVTREFKEVFCAAFPTIAAKYEDWLSDKEDTPRGLGAASADAWCPISGVVGRF